MKTLKTLVAIVAVGLAVSAVGCAAPTSDETGNITETVSTEADGRFIVSDRYADGTVRAQVMDSVGNTIGVVTFEPDVEPPADVSMTIKPDLITKLCKATVVAEKMKPRIVAAPRESSLKRLNAIALVIAVNAAQQQ